MDILSTPVNFLKGVGPSRAELLRNELNISTYGDLLFHYPFRYIDKSQIYNIATLVKDMPYIQLRGRIISFEEKGVRRSKRLIARFQDTTGIIDLVWFKGNSVDKISYKIK